MRGLALLVLGLGWFGHSAETIDFDKAAAGAAPEGWTYPNTRIGEPGRWIVHPDTTAPSKPNVLAQLTADRTRGHVAIALFDRGRCRDGDLSTYIKVVSGKTDQTAGLVWRYEDANNFYYLYVDAMGDKITAHKMIAGKSQVIGQATGTGQTLAASRRIDPQEWNLVKIVFRDQHTTVFFNHRKLLEIDDAALAKAGKTGIWTKGDTVAYFDDFRIDKKKE